MSQEKAPVADSASTTHANRQAARQYRKSDQAMPANGFLCLNAIWLLARMKWEAAGRPDGDSSRFWQEAEKELLEERAVERAAAGRQIGKTPTN
jgi:Protein of unknown function (DUF2934)